MRKLVFLLVLVSAVLGWSACGLSRIVQPSFNGTCKNYTETSWDFANGTSSSLTFCCGRDGSTSDYTITVSGVATSGAAGGRYITHLQDLRGSCMSSGYSSYFSIQVFYCDTETESDSIKCLNTGGLWLDGHCCDAKCLCEREGHQWNESTNSCQSCNEHTNDQTKCDMIWNTGYSTDATGEPGGGGYWQINLYECYYDSCAMSLNCQIKSHFPAGSLSCDDFNDGCQGGDCGRCIAAIGSQCTIQCPNNVTINCACDGSCDHAMTLTACHCPEQSSSSGGSSSSGESSSSGGSSSSGESSSSAESSSSGDSSSSGGGSSGSGGNSEDWEYDYRTVLNSIDNHTSSIAASNKEIATNTNIAAGYLSSIDKWASTINFNMQAESGQIINAIESGATQVANASNAVADSVGHSNEILEQINSSVGVLGDSVEIPDISEWLDSANSSVEGLKNPETTFVRVDSLQSDTSRFKSKYSSMFLTNVYTRNGCYEFKIAKPSQNSVFGRFFSSDIVVNFGNLANTFDLCAILRGICRIAGAILVLLISIKSYRSAFSSSDG